MGEQLYVETLVRADLDEVWRRTQDAAAHTRWDLRFGLIEDESPPDGRARAFRYSHGLGRFRVSGTGTTVGERTREDGSRTSALRFASDHPLSPIRRGHGWWRYTPTEAGVRFVTGYDYTPSWGALGARLDRWLVRPAMRWATAWSFDRLRLWLEHDLAPERALAHVAADTGWRAALLGAAGWSLVKRPTLPRVLALVLAVLAALRTPAPRLVPRASRCLRRPPTERDRRPPTTLRSLEEPS